MTLDQIKITTNIALGLIEAGAKIIELAKREDISEIEILKIIDDAEEARRNARFKAYEILNQKKL